MAQNSHVPEFGKWQDEVQYTAHFDNVRKGKSSGTANPKDPQDKPGSNKAEAEAPKGSEALRSKHEQHLSREVGHPRRSSESPLHHDTVGQRVSSDSPLHHHGGSSSGDIHRRAMRQSVGSDRSIEHSPLHPHNQARVGGKSSDVSSPSWERKGSSQGSSHSLAPLTPGRSRLRSVTRGDDTPDHSAAVPKFGDWDESNPASSEGYTAIFNRVREEKQVEAGKVPATAGDTPYSNGHKQSGNENSKGCFCFPWSRK
ncbi:RPM1-interacting protein 4-like isoform X2 [Corylus avellana]|uniref:RPM1-interacting protein 4-like isoform X2 n=1 Tax=Corylus avellana TaxID=13451 RepID=UPI00286D236C|nr:RPM1-interacting protein 4-like isoform X2 [Corylus avellana]